MNGGNDWGAVVEYEKTASLHSVDLEWTSMPSEREKKQSAASTLTCVT